jgi:hypothetical protein
MMMGLGKEKKRELPGSFSGSLPPSCSRPVVFMPGTLVLEGSAYSQAPKLAAEICRWEGVAEWPVIILVDSSAEATCSMQEFLSTLFTRFEPAADIHGAATAVQRFHVGLTPPIVFDCRMKPWYTDVLEVDEATRTLVDSRIHTLLPPGLR